MATQAAVKAGRPAAGKPAERPGSGDESEPEAGEAPAIELDDRGHAEFLVLYRESSETVRYAKALMWKCVGATLLIQFGLVGLGFLTKPAPLIARVAVGTGILLACGAIYSLVIHQLWQNTERAKLAAMSKALSEPLRTIRAIQSPREANFHRYTLLSFMVVAIAVAQVIATIALAPLYE